MPNNLNDTWNEIAKKWNQWKPPLRPCPEDTEIMKNALIAWQGDGYAPDGYSKAILLGVTPEIANMQFPITTDLLAIERAQNMIDLVWPGDTEYRHAKQGDWFTYSVQPSSQDIVLADGSLVFFNPDRIEHLLFIITSMLKKDGIFVARCFVMPEHKETISTILQDTRLRVLNNFHEFKFRLAMALQKTFENGISQDDVWKSMQTILNVTPNNEFSKEDIETGNFYKGKFAKHYFPTIAELTTILNKFFKSVQVITPTYQFGACCPTIVAKLKRESYQ